MFGKLLSLAAVICVLIPTAYGQTEPPAGASRWPVQVDTSAGQVTVFQPQLEDFVGDSLKARAAVSVQASAQGSQPTFGCVWLQSRAATDRVARTVQILDVQITKTRFPNADDATQAALTSAVQQVFVGRNVTLSLDSLLAMLETIHKQQAAAQQLDFTPPQIVFVEHPAVKVQYDGTPRLVRAENSDLLRAVNTPFFVALDPGTRQYYLKGAGRWFAAPDPMGPFAAVDSVPDEISALANSSGYQDPAPAAGSTTPDASQVGDVEIITATAPTELIWTDGPAEMSTIPGTDLLYVANTNSDVFLTVDSQQFYVLLSGRWYTAPSHDGPWTYVSPDQLPADFSRIPPDSDKADVLADVLGTQQAEDAVADSYVPQTAAVDMHHFDPPPIEYDGSPIFQPIPGTDMTYGVNTDASVLWCQEQYYCCYDGVWYVSGSPEGPWAICVNVPQDVYTIPPTCPIYPVRFCYVYGHTADLCYVGYLPGYSGCFADNGIVVFGTGYSYRPWFGHRFYSRPFTYGFASRYNWYTGHWGFDFAVSFGGGRSWIGRAPANAILHTRGSWFGFGGFRPVYRHDALHATAALREVALGQDRRDGFRRDIYDGRTDVHIEARGAAAFPGPHDAGHEVDHAPPRDDVFADKDGNVYRKSIDGWEARQGDQWSAAHSGFEAHPGGPEDHSTPPEESHDVDHSTPPREFHDNGQQGDHPEADHPESDHPQSPPDQQRHDEQDRGSASHDGQQPPEEKRNEPPPESRGGGDYSDLNRDYQARIEGDDRGRGQSEPAPQPPPQENRGGGGGQHGGGGGHGR